MSSPTVSTTLSRIAEQSAHNPDLVFTTLAHHMTVEFLQEAFSRVRPQAAPGVDGVTWQAYERNLATNLEDLHQRLREGRYSAPPVRRSWLEKEDGRRRPLGIPTLEDKIVQRAVAMLLEAVYEPLFRGFSFGFRPGRSAHQALAYVRTMCLELHITWIVDADVSSFFDDLDHGHLRTFLKKKVNDGALLRLIGKWLKAGVLDQGCLLHPKSGSPQGGVISPILANIYLHYVLDEWMTTTVQPRLSGRCFLVRFADDYVIGCAEQLDAERIYAVLPKRFARFGLTIHPTKSRLLPFGRPDGKAGTDPGTFDFLGFTHYWGKTRSGGWTIKRKTRRARVQRAHKAIWAWCRDHRHWSLPEQYRCLVAKLRGHYAFYGIRGNYKALEVVYEYVEMAWKHWLGRRTRNGSIPFEKWHRKYRQAFPLPKPRIVHSC